MNDLATMSFAELWTLPDEVFLPPAPAARMIHCGESHLAHMRVSGKGPRFHKRGKLVRYKVADIRSWLDSDNQCGPNVQRAQV